MYNSRKVDDALEMCQDIKKYYETEEKKEPKLEGEPDFSITMALDDVQKYIRKEKPQVKWEQPDAEDRQPLSRKADQRSEIVQELPVMEALKKKSIENTSKESSKAREELEGQEETRSGRGASLAKSKAVRVRNTVASMLLCLLIAYGAARFITDYIVQPVRVEGISMENTLMDHDILLVSKLSYRLHEPERFDIIIFPYQPDEYFVKRVIGLPGETVQIQNGKILINGETLLEGYGQEDEIEDGGIAAEALTLGEDEYFVMGDNRNHSMDSRSAKVGVIRRERLEGKALFRLFPWNRMKAFS